MTPWCAIMYREGQEQKEKHAGAAYTHGGSGDREPLCCFRPLVQTQPNAKQQHQSNLTRFLCTFTFSSDYSAPQ